MRRAFVGLTVNGVPRCMLYDVLSWGICVKPFACRHVRISTRSCAHVISTSGMSGVSSFL